MKATRLHLVSFRALQKPRSEEAQKYGGAYVNCWMDATASEAERTAKHHVECSGWRVSGKAKIKLVARKDYERDAQLRRYFDEALKNGLCTVLHTYPRNASRRK